MGRHFRSRSDEDFEDRDVRRSRTRSSLAMLATIAAAVSWCLLGLVAAGGGLLFLVTLLSAESAVQETAIGCVFTAGFLAAFTLAKAVEGVAAAVEKMTR